MPCGSFQGDDPNHMPYSRSRTCSCALDLQAQRDQGGERSGKMISRERTSKITHYQI